MDTRLDETQELLVQVVSALASGLQPEPRALGLEPPDRRWTERGEARIAADHAWTALVDAGLVCLRAPEGAGGAGATGVEVALVAEQLGRQLVPAPFAGPAVIAPALVGADGPVGREIAAGKRRLAVCLSEDLTRFARLGEPAVAFDAAGASAAVVLDDTADPSPHLVSLEGAAFLDQVDLTRLCSRVPAGTPPLGGAVGPALDRAALARAEAVGLVAVAADALGAMGSALTSAVDHVGARRQFGVPVGSFQAVQHMAAHAQVMVEASRSSLWHAAWAVDAADAEAALQSARQAKAFISEEARNVGEVAIQMLGGIGMTWEERAHVRLRRILLDRSVLGDEHAQHQAIASIRLGAGAQR